MFPKVPSMLKILAYFPNRTKFCFRKAVHKHVVILCAFSRSSSVSSHITNVPAACVLCNFVDPHAGLFERGGLIFNDPHDN